MDLSNLKPAKGSVKARKRVGRGQGSGIGGTSTRGMNGAGSRSGHKDKRGFEGGQMPLVRRVPKFGFKNFNRVEYTPVNLDTLQNIHEKFGVDKITITSFNDYGLASKNERVKILARGEIKSKLEVTAHAFSKKAIEAIEKAGGNAIKL
jgi:large subunit ribosomal protein L15